MNLLTQNAKMKKTSKENNAKIFNFSIPAYKTKSGKLTCPFAAACVKYCYAQKGNYKRFPIIADLMEKKYKITKQNNFITLMNEEIIKKKATHIRIHDSGDFYSIEYLLKWVDIATQNTNVIFYAYTKSIPFFKAPLRVGFLSDIIVTLLLRPTHGWLRLRSSEMISLLNHGFRYGVTSCSVTWCFPCLGVRPRIHQDGR